MALPNLAGKRVLVTGASSGIGLETTLAFARRGASLLLVDVNAAGLDTAAQAVRALGAECRTWVVDVADEAAMTALADEVHALGGPLDVLVNNAGIGYIGPFVATPSEAWHRVFGVNVMGVVHGCAAFLPRMLQAGGPRHVVNVASAAGLAPVCNMSVYAASKHAVVGLSDSLAMELATSQVSVSVVCPGIINTPITHVSERSVSKVVSAEQIARLQKFYRENGAPPRLVGEAIVDAVRSGRGIVLVGPIARLIYNLRRLSRGLLLKVLIADSKKTGWI